MQIFLIVLACLITLTAAFVLTDIKAYLEFDNVSSCDIFKIKIYAFSVLPVCILKREIKSEKKKQGIKEKIEMAIDYLIKSKADPIDYVEKKVKKSDDMPKLLKCFDFKEVYLEKMKLNLCLDFNNAAISAISTGAVNAIISMILAKYADNIKGPVEYKVFPGYTGNGIKIEVSAKVKIRAKYLIKLLFESIKKGGK